MKDLRERLLKFAKESDGAMREYQEKLMEEKRKRQDEGGVPQEKRPI